MSIKYNFQGNLTDKEWMELVAVEYILIWNYTDNIERDEARLKELRHIKHLNPPIPQQ